MIACCGLDCSKCEGYRATQADSNAQRAEVARKWSAQYNAAIQPEHINCDGCQGEGRKFFFCANLCELRKCCLTKGLANCAACEMYICDQLKEFIKLAPAVGDALEKLRKQQS